MGKASRTISQEIFNNVEWTFKIECMLLFENQVAIHNINDILIKNGLVEHLGDTK